MIQSPLLPHLTGYVAGNWTGADSGATFDVTNPATGEKLVGVAKMGKAETLRAIAAAKAAIDHIPGVTTRRRWLELIRDALHADKREIGRILCLENGKPWAEAQGEVEYAVSFFDYFARTLEDVLTPEVMPDQVKHCTWTVYKRPIGVVGLITPWNFPIAMIAKKLAPALAAGCPSIIKPAEQTPLTMIALFALMAKKLDLPAGMVNLVTGDAAAIGGALMESPEVAMLSFTGSTAVGRLLMREAAANVTKLDLELGGNAPFVVLDDADLDAAADGLIANKFRAGGQTCVCANRVYVQAGVYDAFTQKVVSRVNALKVGNGIEAGVAVGPMIDQAGFDKVNAHLADALAKGAKVASGKDPAAQRAAGNLFFQPTVLTGVTHNMQCCRAETFGPLVPLIRFDSDADALKAANDTEYGLAAYVFGKDKARAHELIAKLHFGHCGYNTGTGPAAPTPFGGMLSSGIGREGGRAGLLAYVELQTVPDGT